MRFGLVVAFWIAALAVGPAAAQVLITTDSLPPGTVNVPYSVTLTATGGDKTYRWSVTSGSLPDGLSLNVNGRISGIPTRAGSFSFAVRVESGDASAGKLLAIVIAPGLSITTASLPTGTVGTAYSQTLTATGGSPPYTWTLTGGSLPAGLTLTGATIAGTPTAADTSTFTVRASDGQAFAERQLSIVITSPLQITTASLPAGTVGTAYSQTLTATGGTPPYTWTVTAGSLPAGLSLSGATIAGTPTAVGTSTFTVRVSAGQTTAERQLSIVINPPPLQITTASLPAGTVGTAYSQTLTATGGTPPYTWTVSGGSLPAGLSLSGATIAGTPTAAGTSTFTVRVSAGQTTAERQLSIAINPPALQITTTSLPAGTVGAAYSQTLAATGGTPPYTWAVIGNLPAGLTLSGATIAGTPTAAGISTFTVRVSDGQASAERQLSITISPPALQITTASLPAGTVGTAYSQTLAATGGTPPYTWTLSGGNLPAGLSLSGAAIAGTPTAAGTATFTVRVSDGQATAERQLSIEIAVPALRITTTSLPPATVGVSYSQPLSAAGGTPPYTWTIVGTAPPGLAISGNTIAGVPTAAFSAPITVRVSDTGGRDATAQLTFTVQPAPLQITTASLPRAIAGTAYMQQLMVTGGTPPYTWTAADELPPGLSLINGAISGTPTAAGSFSFAVRVTDAQSRTTANTFALTIGPGLTVAALSLPDGSVGTPYSAEVTATGGSPPYSWTFSAGTLPEGLALNGSTGLLSGTPRSAGQYSFSIRVRDAAGVEVTRAYTVQMAAGLIIATAPVLPGGTSGGPYSATLTAAGGRTPYTWSVTAGALPAGLSLDPSTGVISGKPGSSGDFRFTAQVVDNAGLRATKEFTLAIAGALVISSAPNLPDGSVGLEYAVPLTVAGGTRPFVWSVEAGAVPPGLSLEPGTGMLAGKPTAGGTFTFTARVTDSLSAIADKQFQVRIVAGLSIASGALANGIVGSPYTQALSASGGAPPYTWSVTAGALPPGLVLDSARGAITGTPSAGGNFPFTLRVADSSGAFAVREHTIAVSLPSLPSVSINGGADVLQPLQQPLVSVALTAPYPTQITGQLALSFEPDADVPGDDPAVQFATGGRVASFTIPANAAAASFSVPALAFQTGSVSGTIRLRLSMGAGSVDLTPPDGAVRSMRIPRSEPRIVASTAATSTTGFEVRITGLSPPRELSTANVRLTGVPGGDLQTVDLTVPLGESSARWYADPAARQFGSQFTLILPFSVQGNVRSIDTVTVTLQNRSGVSQPASVKLAP
ncbi:MAG TPA: putative Ig domain-containing protein [Bryobacteraceae bacterium]|nr:putative Ig domain-containing protein [Bryobacteraceae bacterium]